MAHRGVGLAGGRDRRRIERVVLALHRTALARVPKAGEALGDEAAHARGARSGDERVGALDPQPVGLREGAVEVPGEPHVRERGGLMDDRVGLGGHDGLDDRFALEQVEHERPRPERAEAFGLRGRPRGAGHLMPPFDQPGNEPGADGTARPCDEDSHRAPFRFRVSVQPDRAGPLL
jgi:hypothetical protein